MAGEARYGYRGAGFRIPGHIQVVRRGSESWVSKLWRTRGTLTCAKGAIKSLGFAEGVGKDVPAYEQIVLNVPVGTGTCLYRYRRDQGSGPRCYQRLVNEYCFCLRFQWNGMILLTSNLGF